MAETINAHHSFKITVVMSCSFRFHSKINLCYAITKLFLSSFDNYLSTYLVSFIILIDFILCLKNNDPEEWSTVFTKLPKESGGAKMLKTSPFVLLF